MHNLFMLLLCLEDKGDGSDHETGIPEEDFLIQDEICKSRLASIKRVGFCSLCLVPTLPFVLKSSSFPRFTYYVNHSTLSGSICLSIDDVGFWISFRRKKSLCERGIAMN